MAVAVSLWHSLVTSDLLEMSRRPILSPTPHELSLPRGAEAGALRARYSSSVSRSRWDALELRPEEGCGMAAGLERGEARLILRLCDSWSCGVARRQGAPLASTAQVQGTWRPCFLQGLEPLHCRLSEASGWVGFPPGSRKPLKIITSF